MNSFRSEPFLWIHFAGIVMVPLLLLVVWLGLAVGEPFLPYGLEFLVVAAVGIVPIVWMQWTRPFDIFSLLIVALPPQKLTPEQRQILRLFKTWKNRVLSVGAALVMVGLLWQLYRLTPLASPSAPLPPQWHALGVLWAMGAFLAANLFLQVPVSVVGVWLTGDKTWTQLEPYELEKIRQDFTILGFPVSSILPRSLLGSRQVQFQEKRSADPVSTEAVVVSEPGVEAIEAILSEPEGDASESSGAVLEATITEESMARAEVSEEQNQPLLGDSGMEEDSALTDSVEEGKGAES